MLLCSDNSIYCGYTTDLARREAMHNAGSASRCTRSRRPVKLVYYETFATKSEALSREAALKKLKHDKKAEMIADFKGLLPSEAGPLLFTDRLVLHPLFDYESEDSEEMFEMTEELEEFLDENPGKRLWYVPWGFSLRSDADNPNAQYLTTPAEPEDDYDDYDDDEDSESEAEDSFDAAEKVLGTIRFSGMPVKGMVEMKFAIEPEYEGQGYMTEALRAAMEWVLHQRGVKYIEAETEAQNAAARRVLEKLAFQVLEMNEKGPRYRFQMPGSGRIIGDRP